MKRIGVINGYVDTALWLAHDQDGNTRDLSELYGFEDLEEKVQKEIESDVDSFLDWLVEGFAEPPALSMGEWSVGSNLFLTASRHGAGFWDCGLDQMYVRHVDTAQESGYGQWHLVSMCKFDGQGLREERKSLGTILTDMAHTLTPPTIWIEHEGRMWMA